MENLGKNPVKFTLFYSAYWQIANQMTVTWEFDPYSITLWWELIAVNHRKMLFQIQI